MKNIVMTLFLAVGLKWKGLGNFTDSYLSDIVRVRTYKMHDMNY